MHSSRTDRKRLICDLSVSCAQTQPTCTLPHLSVSHKCIPFKFKVAQIASLKYLTFTSDEPNLDKSQFMNNASFFLLKFTEFILRLHRGLKSRAGIEQCFYMLNANYHDHTDPGGFSLASLTHRCTTAKSMAPEGSPTEETTVALRLLCSLFVTLITSLHLSERRLSELTQNSNQITVTCFTDD